MAWGHNTVFDYQITPSCNHCRETRQTWLRQLDMHCIVSDASISLQEPVSLCQKCRNWELIGCTPQFQRALPKHYPRKKHKLSPKFPPPRGIPKKNRQYLLPYKHTFETLRDGVKAAIINAISNVWSTATLVTYLNELGVNEERREKIKIHVKVQQDLGLEMDATHVESLRFVSIPKLWEASLPFEIFVCAPMHWIMNVVKSLVSLIKRHVGCYRKKQACLKILTPLMNSIKELHHGKCRIEPFQGTDHKLWTANWLCDNCVAFARIIPVIVTIIHQDVVDSRRVEKTEHSPHYDATLETAFRDMIQAFYAMTTSLFSSLNVPHTVQKMNVKEFLSSMVAFDIAIGTSSQDSFLVNRPNFLSSLVVPDQIREFGPLIYYNELNKEREVQTLRPFLDGLRQTATFLLKRLEKVENASTLKMLAAQGDFTHERRTMAHEFHIYDSLQEIEENLRTGEATLGYRMDDSKGESYVYVFCGDYDDAKQIQLITDDEVPGMVFCGLFYQRLLLATTGHVYCDRQTMIDNLTHPCLILPHSTKKKT